MLTRFVRTQLIIFTIASIIGIGVMVLRLHAGADAARHRPDDRQAGAAENRWAVPVLERDLSRRADRQGDRRAAHRDRRRGDDVAGHLAEDSGGPAGQGAAACRRSASSTWTWCRAPTSGPYLHERLGDPGEEHHRPAGGRPDARSGQHPAGEHPEGPDSPNCSTRSFKALNGAGDDLQHAAGLGVAAGRRLQRGRRPDPRAGRRQPATAGRPGWPRPTRSAPGRAAWPASPSS